MRAFTLYNDNLNCGISIIATVPKELSWGKLEGMMEDAVADLKSMETLETTIKGFTKSFPTVKFESGTIYKDMQSSEVSNMAGQTNRFGVQQSGYQLLKPKKTISVAFA